MELEQEICVETSFSTYWDELLGKTAPEIRAVDSLAAVECAGLPIGCFSQNDS